MAISGTVTGPPDPSTVQFFCYGNGRALHVPMVQFSRKRGSVKICRWFECENYPKWPLREYCSESCKEKFENWFWGKLYHPYFSWPQVQVDVWKRDRGHCRICHVDLRDPTMANHPGYTIDSMPGSQQGKFEFDHIIPIVVALERLGYKFNFKFVSEILHNRKNVRLLCYACHKKVTAEFMSKFRRIKDTRRPDYQEQQQYAYESAMEIYRSLMFFGDIRQTLLVWMN